MPPLRIGRCALGNACTAPDQAIDVQYQCRKCKKQLHGFRSACSMAANENDFREGVICKDQPCVAAPPAAAQPSVDLQAAGLPEFLWDTQRPQQPAGKKRTTKAADNSKGKTPEATAKKRKERDESGASGKSPKKTNAPTSKQTRVRYSNDLKLQVLLEMEMNPSASFADLSRQFDVPSGTIRGWRNDAEQIEKAAHVGMRANAKANLSADPLFKISSAILKLVDLNGRLPPSIRMSMGTPTILATATKVKSLLQSHHASNPDFLTEKEQEALEKFQASDTWGRKWVRDHETSSMKRAQDLTTQVQQAASAFPPERVYILTTIPVFYKVLPNRIYVKESSGGSVPARAALGLTSDDMVTLYVCASQSGEKLPLQCIATKNQDQHLLRSEKQKIVPFIVEDRARSTNRTLQQWFRTVFTPFVREFHDPEDEVLLIVAQEDEIVLCPELLKDATGQISVESLTVSNPNETQGTKSAKRTSATRRSPPMAMVAKAIRQQYKYQMLHDIIEKYHDRTLRSNVADAANIPPNRRGLYDGEVATLADAMRILESKWKGMPEENIIEDTESLRRGGKKSTTAGRPKSEIRKLYNRQKRTLVDALSDFFKDFRPADQTKSPLDMAVDRMKNTLTDHRNYLLESKTLLETLEQWTNLESSEEIGRLWCEEIKAEMRPEYLAGIKTFEESLAAPLKEQHASLFEGNSNGSTCRKAEPRPLDEATALDLATTMKETAAKLFGQHYDGTGMLGDLAVKLEAASDAVLTQLRKPVLPAGPKRKPGPTPGKKSKRRKPDKAVVAASKPRQATAATAVDHHGAVGNGAQALLDAAAQRATELGTTFVGDNFSV